MTDKTFLYRIVVKFQDHLNLPYGSAAEVNEFFLQNDILPWQHFLKLFPGIRIAKLFTSISAEEIIAWVNKAKRSDPEYQPPDFLSYYTIDCPHEIKRDELLPMLLSYKVVEQAYTQSGSFIAPPVNANRDPLNCDQGYLNPAPYGIDARYAWNFRGGDGDGNVRFIDMEQGWLLDHESISVETLPLTGINHSHHDHGAAVLGIIMMKDNVEGGIGITPKVNGHVISQWRPDGSPNTADAIMAAIDHLNFGDILLLEAQTRDPLEKDKVWPIEINEAIFQVIRLASALGIVVIEAAGNGNSFNTGSDLDNFTLNNKNIFDPNSSHFRDSGAIIVAAASSTVPHTRIRNSTYGNRVNCYAWGEKVVTVGNYPRSSGIVINTYTRNFSGTSSASAIIAGAAIAVQSIAAALGKPRLSPLQMRKIFSNELFGTPSKNGHAIDKIGVMPDLKKIIDNVLNIPVEKAINQTEQWRYANS
ncbi:MAG TPA: S8 family serine peptidase [Chitinophagaceae bacterium]|jgi:hypothetical protein|nr:S8 family serine peptidase [Chitinophagaceae bacterium]